MAKIVARCRIHKIELVCFCPACRGSATSKRKAASSRENGKLGGRPPGKKTLSRIRREQRTARKGK